jgi:hypothetical protein
LVEVKRANLTELLDWLVVAGLLILFLVFWALLVFLDIELVLLMVTVNLFASIYFKVLASNLIELI